MGVRLARWERVSNGQRNFTVGVAHPRARAVRARLIMAALRGELGAVVAEHDGKLPTTQSELAFASKEMAPATEPWARCSSDCPEQSRALLVPPILQDRFISFPTLLSQGRDAEPSTCGRVGAGGQLARTVAAPLSEGRRWRPRNGGTNARSSPGTRCAAGHRGFGR